MSIMNTVNEGYTITKKSWFAQTVYVIVFTFIFSIIIIPFSFLVAITAVLRNDYNNGNMDVAINTFNDLIDDMVANPLFWITVYLLILVMMVFISMLLGMVQLIGKKNFSHENGSLEDSIKHPFRTQRLLPFILLAFLESIVIAIVGVFLNFVRDFLNLNTTTTVESLNDVINNFISLENIAYMIISLAIFLIFIPPFMISCLAIAEDKAKYNAFIVGWTDWAKSFVYFEGVTIVSLIPTAIVLVLISLIGVAMTEVVGYGPTVSTTDLTANELAIILTLSFGIILLFFVMLIFLLPFYFNAMSKSFDDQKTHH